jgi:HEAT repeat protein
MTWKWLGRLVPPRRPPTLTPEVTDGLGLNTALIALLEDLPNPPGAFVPHPAERLRDGVRDLPASAWVRLDETLRRSTAMGSQYSAPHWLRAPEDVRRLTLPAATEGAVLGLLASHRSGYVREEAVRRLALVGDGTELPPLLVRANDWVDPVRERAVNALRARLVPAYAEHWVRALPLVLRLRDTGRGDAQPLVDEVLALLDADEAHEAVRSGLYIPDRAVNRACFAILARPGAPGHARLAFDVLGSDHVSMRLSAVHLARSLGDPELRDLLPVMLRDRASSVRLAAVRLARERDAWGWAPAVRALLLDRAAAVRGEVRALLSAAEPMDFAAFYLEQVRDGSPRLAEAAAGLAETRTAEDAGRIAPLVDHGQPRVRAAALRALARLTGDAAVPALVRAVGDASPRVSRAAADALPPRIVVAQAGALAGWMDAAHPLHVRRNALRLLSWRGKWDGIAWILRGCGDADPEIRGAARSHLNRWLQRFNRTFSQPTTEQMEAVRVALEENASAVDPKAAADLRFIAGVRG